MTRMTHIGRWDKKDVAELRKLVQKGYSGKQIGKLMGLSRNSVLGKIHREGIRAELARKNDETLPKPTIDNEPAPTRQRYDARWTEKEDEIMRRNYNRRTVSLLDLSHRLGRSKAAIEDRAYLLGLRPVERPLKLRLIEPWPEKIQFEDDPRAVDEFVTKADPSKSSTGW